MDAQHVALTLFRIADEGGQLENNFQNDVHVSFPKIVGHAPLVAYLRYIISVTVLPFYCCRETDHSHQYTRCGCKYVSG